LPGFADVMIAESLAHRSGLEGAPPWTNGPVIPLPATAPAGGGGAANGGFGLYFFGIPALLALAFLVAPRLAWTLRTTVRLIRPQPFLSLLERPG
jgi:hypothetical protein